MSDADLSAAGVMLGAGEVECQEMREFYIIIDQYDDCELVYNPTRHSDLLDMIIEMHPCPKWIIERADYRVTVFPIALFRMPVGEDREEIEQRVLNALKLE